MPEPRGIAIGDKDSLADCFARRVVATPDAVAYRDFDGLAVGGGNVHRDVIDVTVELQPRLAHILSKFCRP